MSDRLRSTLRLRWQTALPSLAIHLGRKKRPMESSWWRLFEAMSDDSDFEYLIVDTTIIRAHQHASTEKGVKIRPLAALAAA